MLHRWDHFFVMTGTAGATLIGLLFVIITLGTGMFTARGVLSTSVFQTPTLIHFGGVLFESLFVLAPWSVAVGVCAGAVTF
jgi:hypothetical protein